ncbi:MAG TPA: DedA family protein [Candidatus Eremiobacteraceae bacterium]|nr:DedA family protein [Candidatus Eremiobacteraceae bacterium]
MHALEHATSWIIGLISHLGYMGLFFGMFAQAVGIPLSSEVQLGFAGYLASKHVLEIIPVMIAGAAGDISGAIVAYLIGYYGGRPFLLRFGRFFFVHEREIERADEWFARYGSRAVLVLKLLPGIRAFGSFPAGVTRMAFGTFLGYTTLGAVIWSVLFAGIGFTLGRNWVLLGAYARPASFLLLGLVVIAIVIWLWMHFRAERRSTQI